ncbi:MAG: hypothetical protein GY950_14515 [bacterium]|nr:hypothetical protein [bacterium]
MRQGLILSFINMSIKRLNWADIKNTKDKTSRKSDIPVLKMENRGNFQSHTAAGAEGYHRPANGKRQTTKI